MRLATSAALALSMLVACGGEAIDSSSASMLPPPAAEKATATAVQPSANADLAVEGAGREAPIDSADSNSAAPSSAEGLPPSAAIPGDSPVPIAGAPASQPASQPETRAASPQPSADPSEFGHPCDEVHILRAHAADDPKRPFVVAAGQEVHARVPIAAPWGSEPVQLIEMKPRYDNAKILHHVTLVTNEDQILVGISPGRKGSVQLPPDVGIHLPGGDLSLDLHYYNVSGSADESDESGLALCILKQNRRPHTATLSQVFAEYGMSIPPHATNYTITGHCTYSGTQTVQLISAGPHAHKLARHMKFELTKRSGRIIVMHDAAYDFNEQNSYPLPEPLQLEPGDRVSTTCVYDNPTDATVVYGDDTGDEMCFNFALFYPMVAISCATDARL